MNKDMCIPEKLGDIVAKYPRASEVFKAYKIDFCCGGGRTLREVLQGTDIDPEGLMEVLENICRQEDPISAEQTDWINASSKELIDHIVNTHHGYLKKELPVISEYIAKILRVHGIHHGESLFRLHTLFHTLKTELEQHLIKEEELLFPLIQEYEKHPSKEIYDKLTKVMAETEGEHDGAGDLLKQMRAITDQYTMPADGCTTYALTYQKLEALESDMFQHVHLENNILFSRYPQQ